MTKHGCFSVLKVYGEGAIVYLSLIAVNWTNGIVIAIRLVLAQSLLALTRCMIHSLMSLSSQATALAPIFTGLGK